MNCHYRYYDLNYFFKTISELGFTACEIWTSPHHFSVNSRIYESPDKLLELSNKYKVKIASICPEQTNPKPYNIAERDPKKQKEVLSYFKNIIEIAKLTKANKIVITSGWSFLNEDKELAYQRSVKMMRKICKFAEENHVDVALEALQPEESRLVNSINDLVKYREKVSASSLKICLDMGAMARMEETIEEYFQTFGNDIVHIHFVDGNPTGHLAWGDGKRDMSKDIAILKKYGYSNYLSLENATSRYFMNPKDTDIQNLKSFEINGGKI